MSGAYGAVDEAESVATIRRALDLGVNFFDTAPLYGRGHNERLLGKALGKRRPEAVIATKFGAGPQSDGSSAGPDGRPETIFASVEESLDRLGTDVIDLLFQHRVDPKVPIEETVGAMSRLVEQGKVRYLGLSEAAAATIRRAHDVHPIAALQTEFSIWYRDPELELLPLCHSLGIGFVAYSPLGRALLTGSVRTPEDIPTADHRHLHPRFQAGNLQANLHLVGRLNEVADEVGCSLAQLALAWLLARAPEVVPIPGTKRRSYLEEDAAAASITLSRQQLVRVDEIAPVGSGAGERYPWPNITLIDQG